MAVMEKGCMRQPRSANLSSCSLLGMPWCDGDHAHRMRWVTFKAVAIVALSSALLLVRLSSSSKGAVNS